MISGELTIVLDRVKHVEIVREGLLLGVTAPRDTRDLLEFVKSVDDT